MYAEPMLEAEWELKWEYENNNLTDLYEKPYLLSRA